MLIFLFPSGRTCMKLTQHPLCKKLYRSISVQSNAMSSRLLSLLFSLPSESRGLERAWPNCNRPVPRAASASGRGSEGRDKGSPFTLGAAEEFGVGYQTSIRPTKNLPVALLPKAPGLRLEDIVIDAANASSTRPHRPPVQPAGVKVTGYMVTTDLPCPTCRGQDAPYGCCWASVGFVAPTRVAREGPSPSGCRRLWSPTLERLYVRAWSWSWWASLWAELQTLSGVLESAVHTGVVRELYCGTDSNIATIEREDRSHSTNRHYPLCDTRS